MKSKANIMSIKVLISEIRKKAHEKDGDEMGYLRRTKRMRKNALRNATNK